MTRLTMLFYAWLLAVAIVVAANPRQAAAINLVSYVSNTGNNSNDCGTPATACGDFSAALSKTQNYGEIDCVNAGDFSAAFTISQSVTIDCAGGVGYSIGGDITINGGGIVVRLRNLSINRFGDGKFGIDAKNMAALYIENCVITNVNAVVLPITPYLGIKFEPSANAQLFVTNTIISNNGDVGGSTGGGISIAPTSGATASVTLEGVKLLGNVYGIGMNSTGGVVVGTLRHSTISGSNVSGLVAFGGGSPIFWTVDGSTIMNNPSFGIQTLGSGVNLQIGTSTITGNGTGVSGPGITSYKDNHISGNASDGTPIPAVPGASGTLF
jgi:hypothetical protein